MSTTTYLLEYVRLEMMRDPETAVNRWAAAFNRARAAFRYQECQEMLVGVKSLSALTKEAQAIIWHSHGGLLHQLQKWDEAIDRYQRSLTAFEDAGNLLGQSQVLSDLGNIYQTLGQWPQAAQFYSRALPLKRQFAHPGDLAATINNLAVNQADLGEPARALETLAEALALYHEIGNQEGIGQTLINRGSWLARLGKLTEAEEAYT